MTARPMLRLGLFAIVAFAVGLLAARFLLAPRHGPPPVTEDATLFAPPRELPELRLVDQDGRAFTTATLRDRWTVVFFGFTHCPDVCPTTLSTLAQVRKLLADLPATQQPHVLFVTVDPERDTPQRLRQYVRFFDPSFAAVTGALPDIERAASAFSIPFARIPLPQGGYTMDHGAGVFFVSPEAAVVAYSSPPLAADVLARDYRMAVDYFTGLRG